MLGARRFRPAPFPAFRPPSLLLRGQIGPRREKRAKEKKKGPPPGAGSGAEPQVSNTFRGEHGGRRKTAVINNRPENGRKKQPQWLAQSAGESTQQPSRF